MPKEEVERINAYATDIETVEAIRFLRAYLPNAETLSGCYRRLVRQEAKRIKNKREAKS